MNKSQHEFVTKMPCQTSFTSFYDRGIALGEKEKMLNISTPVRFLTLTWYFQKEDKETWAWQKYAEDQAAQTWLENHSLSK